ncbi:MAG: pseudouridylate synthase [Polyangiaceae bacterium]|nr:pseudouridylate synthase [Polyangiaceae bacterium]
MRVECLHEDDMMFVLNKPSGLLVHRGWDNAETALVDRARELTRGGTAHPIQRLDRGASGPVLFAKSAETARELSNWARAGYCRKDYLALVRGECPERIDIDHPIHRRLDGPRVEARTLARCVAVAQTEPRHVSVICARPLTGRLHQIRRHMKHANHPLIGDGRYGRGDLNRAFRERYGLARLALHACSWRVVRPDSRTFVGGLVPLPEDLSEPLCRMGFDLDDNRLPRDLQGVLDQLVPRLD